MLRLGMKLKEFEAHRNVIAVLLVVLVLTAGCGVSRRVKVGSNDNGSQIELENGQLLVIALDANPTTGYMWEIVEPDEHILRQVGEGTFHYESELVGAPGVETLRFEAVSTGQTVLKMVYHRSWEKDVAPLETFSLQVVVR